VNDVNAAGAEGWELVNVAVSGGSNFATSYVKRPWRDAEKPDRVSIRRARKSSRMSGQVGIELTIKGIPSP
jgi:hypothetical protein